MQTHCAFCGTHVVLVHVHGHYQCPVCKTNALPCCDGDNCDNFMLATKNDLVYAEERRQTTDPIKNQAPASSKP